MGNLKKLKEKKGWGERHKINYHKISHELAVLEQQEKGEKGHFSVPPLRAR